jgi:hypothetical protein
MAFTCQVCFEETDKRFALPELKTGNGDVLRKQDCQHPICQECLAHFVTARVEEQLVFHVRCPFEGCTNEIFEQDVKRLADATPASLSASIATRFAELRARDFTSHAASLRETWTSLIKEDDYDLIQKLWQSTRLCPRCSLVIERSQGCNSFYCVCGHHFDYASAPRVVGNGIRNFGDVVELAKRLKVPLERAQNYGLHGDEWRLKRALASADLVSRTAAETRLSPEEAWELLQQAKTGDVQAREKIRRARSRGVTTAEDESDEEFTFDLWDNRTKEATDELADEEVEKQNTTITKPQSTPAAPFLLARAKSNPETVKSFRSLAEKTRNNAYTKAVLVIDTKLQNITENNSS